jgi:uncharacterized protein (DUF1778 family)
MTTTVLSVRVSQEERAILEAASEQARTSLSEFVRRKAVDAAESDMLERRIITILAKDWEAFEAWSREPALEIPAIKELAAEPDGSETPPRPLAENDDRSGFDFGGS